MQFNMLYNPNHAHRNPLCKYFSNEVQRMKTMKARITAAALAGAMSICGAAAQAVPAFAFEFSSYTQLEREQQSTMDQAVSAWKTSTQFKSGKNWTNSDNISSGVVVGKGYSSQTPSNRYSGTQLSGSDALARALAQNYYDTTIFMELHAASKEFNPQIGDQIVLTNGSTSKTVFVTSVSGSIKVVELVNNKVTYDVSYSMGNGSMRRGGVNWTTSYVIRPIKQGDVNGDSYMYALDHGYGIYSDVDAMYDIVYNNNGQLPSGARSDVMTAAISLNGDWSVTTWDYWLLQYGHGPENGRMDNNSYGYVKTLN